MLWEHRHGRQGQGWQAPASDDGKPKKPPPQTDDYDDEDGDIATPKRDRHGDDDEPLE